MKNKVKITTLILALMVSMVSIVGCSNNNSTSTEANVSSNSSIESSAESSIEEFSTLESSAEISSETTSTAESSVSSSSNSSAVDPAVEERSYSDEEKYKPQPTKFSDYSYYPAGNGYEYSGSASKVTIPSEFKECPGFYYDNNVKEIIVPETVTKIPKGAFTGCKNLEKLVILNPDCEIDGRILPKADPNENYDYYNTMPVDIYCYFRSDKTVPKTRQYGSSECGKAFNAVAHYYTGTDYDECLHDLAEESYE